jgi:hypothetical protein
MKVNEELIEKYMRNGKYSREEAIELIEYDNAIDKGLETQYDLTVEQKANQKKVRNSLGNGKVRTKKPMTIKNKEKKEDKQKQELLQMLINGIGEEVKIINNERQFQFSIGDDTFEVTLTKKRKKKA